MLLNEFVLLLICWIIAPVQNISKVPIIVDEDKKCYASPSDPAGKCYFLSKTKRDWSAAQEVCIQNGGVLASYSHTEDHLLLSDIMNSERLESAFIGAKENRTPWSWQTNNKDVLAEFTPWLEDRPQPDEVLNSCVMMLPYAGFMWRDTPCAFAAGYVCQVEVPYNKCYQSHYHHFDQTVYDTSQQTCLLFKTSEVNWYDAVWQCKQRNTTLAKISTLQMQEVIIAAAPGSGQRVNGFWIGLSRARWHWTTGTEIMQHFWGPSQPSRSGQCAMLERYAYSLYSWGNWDCNNPQRFFCEIDLRDEGSGDTQETVHVSSKHDVTPPTPTTSVHPQTPVSPNLNRTSLSLFTTTSLHPGQQSSLDNRATTPPGDSTTKLAIILQKSTEKNTVLPTLAITLGIVGLIIASIAGCGLAVLRNRRSLVRRRSDNYSVCGGPAVKTAWEYESSLSSSGSAYIATPWGAKMLRLDGGMGKESPDSSLPRKGPASELYPAEVIYHNNAYLSMETCH